MEIDHVFLRAKIDAPEADLLRQFGLTEGSGNQHPGQGTANRRFFFCNAYIEFMWVSDESDIRSDITRPTMLYERLSDTSVSPFGVCFRPTAPASCSPFSLWNYAPKYLPNGMEIGIGSDVPLTEPMWFFLENGKAPAAVPDEHRQPLKHAVGVREITSIAIASPHEKQCSDAARAAIDTGKISIVEGEHHLMEITFDNNQSGQQHDFRPALPLVFNY